MQNSNPSFHNTADLGGGELFLAELRAKSAEAVITAHFRRNPRAMFTPSEIHTLRPTAPITSIRRAMCNLTRDGILEKLPEQKDGPYNVPEHCWRLAPAKIRAVPDQEPAQADLLL